LHNKYLGILALGQMEFGTKEIPKQSLWIKE